MTRYLKKLLDLNINRLGTRESVQVLIYGADIFRHIWGINYQIIGVYSHLTLFQICQYAKNSSLLLSNIYFHTLFVQPIEYRHDVDMELYFFLELFMLHCSAELHIIKIICLAQPLTFLENIRSENFKTCKMKILGLRPGSGGQLQDRELGYLPPPWVGMIWGWKWNLFNQTYIGKHYSNTKM